MIFCDLGLSLVILGIFCQVKYSLSWDDLATRSQSHTEWVTQRTEESSKFSTLLYAAHHNTVLGPGLFQCPYLVGNLGGQDEASGGLCVSGAGQWAMKAFNKDR